MRLCGYFAEKTGDFGFYLFLSEKRLADMLIANYNAGFKFYNIKFVEAYASYPANYEAYLKWNAVCKEPEKDLAKKC